MFLLSYISFSLILTSSKKIIFNFKKCGKIKQAEISRSVVTFIDVKREIYKPGKSLAKIIVPKDKYPKK